jgi:hypothetical protein
VLYPGALPSGCVVPNGGTIGSASSGATNRANADTADLFAFYWGLTNNTDYPIQDSTGAASTRGASAADDFAANKRFPLPNIQDGDALVAAVSSAVLTRTVGEVLSHTHTITSMVYRPRAHDYAHSNRLEPNGAGGIPDIPFTGRGRRHLQTPGATSHGNSGKHRRHQEPGSRPVHKSLRCTVSAHTSQNHDPSSR